MKTNVIILVFYDSPVEKLITASQLFLIVVFPSLSYLQGWCQAFPLYTALINVLCFQVMKVVSGIRGGSRTTATSKMERFVIIVNGWKQKWECKSRRYFHQFFTFQFHLLPVKSRENKKLPSLHLLIQSNARAMS